MKGEAEISIWKESRRIAFPREFVVSKVGLRRRSNHPRARRDNRLGRKAVGGYIERRVDHRRAHEPEWIVPRVLGDDCVSEQLLTASARKCGECIKEDPDPPEVVFDRLRLEQAAGDVEQE